MRVPRGGGKAGPRSAQRVQPGVVIVTGGGPDDPARQRTLSIPVPRPGGEAGPPRDAPEAVPGGGFTPIVAPPPPASPPSGARQSAAGEKAPGAGRSAEPADAAGAAGTARLAVATAGRAAGRLALATGRAAGRLVLATGRSAGWLVLAAVRAARWLVQAARRASRWLLAAARTGTRMAAAAARAVVWLARWTGRATRRPGAATGRAMRALARVVSALAGPAISWLDGLIRPDDGEPGNPTGTSPAGEPESSSGGAAARTARPRPQAAQPADPQPSRSRGRLRPATVAAAAAWTVAGIALFTCYLHASRTVAVNSDGASNALQAWDMLHGNPLLRGWQLSDVSFYTTELPQYALIERFAGLGPDVVHIAGAMTYTLVVLLAALLAKGRAAGAEAVTRSMIAAGIMLSPQLGTGIYVLMLSPDHVGSAVPVLLLWLILDRARRRWIAPPAVLAVLTWALVADQIVLYSAALPVIGVSCVRAYQAWRESRERPAATDAAVEAATAAAAIGAIFAASAIVRGIAAAGGFRVWPVGSMLAPFAQLPHSIMITVQGQVTLFGADFFGQPAGWYSGLAALHLAGLCLAAWAACLAWRRFGRAELAVQLLAAATAVSLAAYLLGTRATDLNSSRDLAAVLPFGAALAGRLLAARIAAARLLPALTLVLAGYLLSLGRVVAAPPVLAQDSQLVSWLVQHRLQSGLGGYWDANVVTLDSGGRIRLSPVLADGQVVVPGYWEVNRSWYDAARDTATFAVLVTPPVTFRYPSGLTVRDSFGQPASINYVGRYTVLVWSKNLVADLPARPPAQGPVQAPPGALP
jgi:hypothetical protein